jgi:hypothetical protein
MYLSRGRALALLVVTVGSLVYARFTFGGPDPASVIEVIEVRLVAPCRLSDDGRVVDARVAVTSQTTEPTQVVLRLAVSERESTEAVWQDVALPGGHHQQTVAIQETLDTARPDGKCAVGVDY